MLLFVALAAILQLNSAGNSIVVHFLVSQNGFAGENRNFLNFFSNTEQGASKFPTHRILQISFVYLFTSCFRLYIQGDL